MYLTRNVMMKYRAPAGEGGEGGGSGGATGADAIAAGLAAAAAKTVADAAAEKAASDAEAAAKAAAADKGEKKPTDDEAKLLKEVMDKKAKLDKATIDNAALQAKLKEFDGIDPVAIKALLATQKTAEDKALEDKGDYERLKARMAEEHTKEVKTLQEQLLELQTQVGKANGTINDLSIGTQFGQSKFIGDELTLTANKARLIYGDHFDLENGKIVGYDKPRGSAGRTPLVDASGNAHSFDAAMKQIVDADPEKDDLYRSKIKQGANSDSKKATTDANKKEVGTDSFSKISSGIQGLKIF